MRGLKTSFNEGENHAYHYHRLYLKSFNSNKHFRPHFCLVIDIQYSYFLDLLYIPIPEGCMLFKKMYLTPRAPPFPNLKKSLFLLKKSNA